MLCGLGAYAALGRTYDLLVRLRHGASTDVVSARDRKLTEQLTRLLRLDPESERVRAANEDVAAFSRKYVEQPGTTLLHAVPGALFMTFAALQFSNRIRRRYLEYHRWSGRILLVCIALIGLSGLVLGWIQPFGGTSETIVVTIVSGLFLFSAARAYVAIRAGAIRQHREWMTRMFALGIGISVIRLIDLAIVAITQARPSSVFAPSLWIGWIVSAIAAELWLRRQRAAGRPRRARVAADSIPVSPAARQTPAS